MGFFRKSDDGIDCDEDEREGHHDGVDHMISWP